MTKNHRIRSLIYARFQTAAAMARYMGWGKQKLHRIVSGIQIPDLDDLSDISRALDCPIGTLADLFLSEMSPNGRN